MRIIDRFDIYMAYAHLTDNKVTNQLGLTNGVIGKSRKPGRDLSDRVIELIENYYQDLNINWLKTGTGDMLKGPIELLADRLSEIIIDTRDSMKNIDHAFGLEYGELGQFTNLLKFPPTPFDFVKFIHEYPEFNYIWILTGVGEKFIGDEEKCLEAIHNRVLEKKHAPLYSNQINTGIDPDARSLTEKLWEQIEFLNNQIKEKDYQINHLLGILSKK